MAVVFSDIHLSLSPPIARSREADWWEAMRKPLRFLRKIVKTYPHAIPLCAGDVFHHWDSKPELINFALQELPDEMWAIPGQHDLPMHNMELMHRSAFWTLVQAGKVHIPSSRGSLFTVHGKRMQIYGFPYGREVEPPEATCPP